MPGQTEYLPFRIFSRDFKKGEEIPENCGKDHGNKRPIIELAGTPPNAETFALIMDDPDAKKVPKKIGGQGKIWVHYLFYHKKDTDQHDDRVEGKNSWGEIGYGGPAPPDKRHTYDFKAYALNTTLDLKEGYSKQELKDAMKGHIIAEAKLTGTYAP